jgi:hypothetical protein
MSLDATSDVGPLDARCSARDCRGPAQWRLEWRNPRIHTAERVKTWLACDAHRQGLADFLSARSFLLDVVAFGADPPAAPESPAD